MRVCSSIDFPEIVHVFSPTHYIRHSQGEDEFSRRLNNFYIYGNEPEAFLRMVMDLFDRHFKKDPLKYDFVTLQPSRIKNSINNNMKSLVENFSKETDIEYKQILNRNKTIKGNHELNTYEERKKNMEGSIEITTNVKGKNILILDNITTTGTSLLYSANLLKEKGTKNVVCIVLGLSDAEKETDFDLTPKRTASFFMEKFKSKKISKEKREEWKKTTLSN